MHLENGAHIHDPFSGAGTTAIESSLEGYRNSCIEINPFLHFVNRVCLDWSLKVHEARAVLADIERDFRCFKGETSLETITDLGIGIPPIHNVERWWRADVLHEMLCLKAAIGGVEDPRYRDFFRLTLAAVLVPDLTNVTLGRLQLHFIDRSKDDINPWRTFEAHARVMIEDLVLLNNNSLVSQTVLIHGDATRPESYESLEEIDAVVTSPPYPNRYSYVWNTRPHLYMLDFIVEAKSASEIDRRTIGGTWGTATSELMKGEIAPRSDVLAAALAGLHERIRAKDNLMANYVVHYFNRLQLHLEALSTRLSPSAKLAYVVGNSWIKDEYVATDIVLSRLIEGTVGAKVTKVHRFRRRHSGKDLFESIVYASR
ncbi:hypothetical protein ILT44_12445 [Microvirga sp. BT689]|uniref:hypothetical protein n=1 Tax=Microvirga arvi TaxID=2778731 RepID=UPI001950A916|nr:hypothetical protein [Microvirga arvi]MBM6580995.1 hypothetical protein [Microvirga arvi]